MVHLELCFFFSWWSDGLYYMLLSFQRKLLGKSQYDLLKLHVNPAISLCSF